MRKPEAQRRREAAELLAIIAATASYSSHQLGNGLTPQEARQAAAEAAGELADAAAALHRLAVPSPVRRRQMARELAGCGMRRREIAWRLGIAEETVRRYLEHP